VSGGIGAIERDLESAWNIGEAQFELRRPDLGRHVFKAPFEAVERLLKSWNREEDGVVDVNALKELKINSERLIADQWFARPATALVRS
jgi:hypothetical protein